MTWTSPIPSGPAWGTVDSSGNHIGLSVDTSSPRIAAKALTGVNESEFNLDSLLFAPANVPIVLPFTGELQYTGGSGGPGGGSTRPTTGMLYPRGQG